jgi:predicted alpha/beta superfamily hydrolase
MKHIYQIIAFLGYVSQKPLQLITLRAAVLAAMVMYGTSTSAQLTIKVIASPINTPATAMLYAAGNFNSWNPADAASQLTSLGDGKYIITLYPAPGQVEFKFTRGSWNTVEGNIGGLTQPSHKVFYGGQPKTIEVSILSWPDLMGNGGSNVTIPTNGVINVLNDNYFIPQLNRTRRIWAYLPPDYGINPNKRYPVLYMQDGQNLFDPTNTNDWKIDEAMDMLAHNGDPGCIIIGIDNGGAFTNNEYSPWATTSLGGGEGKEYVEFIVATLKPYIDNNYLTLSDRDHTGIMGSAMGGLISMYALVEYQDVFSKAGIFSPLFTFVGNKMVEHIQQVGKLSDVRVFFLAGAQEPSYVSNGMESVIDAMLTSGFDLSEINISTPTDGEHNVWFWSREFPAAYKWLFENAQASVPTNEHLEETLTMTAFPNPTTTWVQLEGEALDQNVNVRIIGMDGRVWYEAFQVGTQTIFTGNLPQGAFSLSVTDMQGRTRALQLIHE